MGPGRDWRGREGAGEAGKGLERPAGGGEAGEGLVGPGRDWRGREGTGEAGKGLERLGRGWRGLKSVYPSCKTQI